ncbi:flagellar basal-body MS-ring/collar protein FliF [Priestia abyssalis]|uniref:flagellar basal-body MS-ring/collar protein FliF n=1 Tax=Priestia abyssalis TaxID=1221450 RepID=UPI000995098A|nr:flagellar basal-body MS-ring/collar protein FliF [Priestia abyssalis]
MNEKLLAYKEKTKEYWSSRSKRQKGLLIGGPLAVFFFAAIITYMLSKDTFVPLYSNLSPQETGQIKAELDGRGIKSQLSDDGKTISVPEEVVDTLKVELAAEGIPKSGSIDYSFFSQNAGFGMTDNEFNVLKVDAMQTEIANLMKNIDGVNDASVMITLPEKSIWVNDQTEEASASIVLNTKPGYEFDEQQVKSLYHLVSKSVPNLPTDNIVIMNQYFEYFDLKSKENFFEGSSFVVQHEMKKEIERDIQRQVQQMLGTMMGYDKVVVSVTADVDFTKENREENIIEPVDKENMEGIAVSVERITETYTGDGAQAAGGIEGTGENDISSYQESNAAGSDGDYERVEERINNDVNRIRKEIVESPYKVRDLGIQVMVEPPNPENPDSLSQERVDDITQILGTIVRTTVQQPETEAQLTNEEISDRVVVSVQPFNGKPQTEETETSEIPIWMYAIGAGLVIVILVLLFLLFRRKRKEESIDEYEDTFVPLKDAEIEELPLTESQQRRQKLEQLAKDQPEEFAKLLRTWIAEE